ncbi:unnamed protein product [marine sediment metagenome]|uniref:Uncharacterized protein n=1 Tax=marine sediment metagenome TaxID=412755 RepID=X0V2A7_9ZZZZ
MFPADVYVERRSRLKEQVQSGLIFFLGNEESPMNYQDNSCKWKIFTKTKGNLYYCPERTRKSD